MLAAYINAPLERMELLTIEGPSSSSTRKSKKTAIKKTKKYLKEWEHVWGEGNGTFSGSK